MRDSKAEAVEPPPQQVPLKLMSASKVRRVIGNDALALWKLEVAFRDSGVDEVFLSRKGMVRRVDELKNVSQAKRCLTVLRDVGLLRDLEPRRIKHVNKDGCWRWEEVRPREAFGKPYGEDFILIPGDAHARITLRL